MSDAKKDIITKSLGDTLRLGMNFTIAPDGSFLCQLFFGSMIIGIDETFEAAYEVGNASPAYFEYNFTQILVQTYMDCGATLTYCTTGSMRLSPKHSATVVSQIGSPTYLQTPHRSPNDISEIEY